MKQNLLRAAAFLLAALMTVPVMTSCGDSTDTPSADTTGAAETTAETVLLSREKAESLAAMAKLPLVMTTVAEPLLRSSLGQALADVPDLFPLRLQKKY